MMGMINESASLSREEALAYEFARHWRAADYHPPMDGLDGQRFAEVLCRNRMAVLALPILERTGGWERIPRQGQKELRTQAAKYRRASARLGDALAKYLEGAAPRGLKTIVLKGLWLCEKIYGRPDLRPGADIDILLPRRQVADCLSLLKEQGIAEYWPNLLNDEYFYRHHLHQQRSTPDLNVWFEIHWALDHPYTLMTVDYEGIFERTRPSSLLGAPVLEMSPPDLLLSLAIHLVKHAVYLPSLLERPDLPRILLADGLLTYFLDITEVLKREQPFDWDLTLRLARQWGVVEIMGSVLQTCQRTLQAPVPAEAFVGRIGPASGGIFDNSTYGRINNPTPRAWPLMRGWMSHAADQELAAYENRPGNPFWKLLLASNGAFILRPVRLLETTSYFFAPTDYLRRRYGSSNLLTRLRHSLNVFRQALRFGWDSIYFGLERYVRLKRLGRSASLFNHLEIDL